MRRLSGNGPPPLSVTSSANVVDSGSSRTVAASWKLTRCLLRFAAAFAGSHSNCTARVYGPVPGDHQTAEREGVEPRAAKPTVGSNGLLGSRKFSEYPVMSPLKE